MFFVVFLILFYLCFAYLYGVNHMLARSDRWIGVSDRCELPCDSGDQSSARAANVIKS